MPAVLEKHFEKVPFKNVVLGAVFKHEGIAVQKMDEPELIDLFDKSPKLPKSYETTDGPKGHVSHRHGNNYNAFSTWNGKMYVFHPDTEVEARPRGIKSPQWRK